MFIKTRVFPQSKKQEIIKKADDSFDIIIKEKPINGKANKRVIKILCNYFKIPNKSLKLVKGSKKKKKIFKILNN